MHQSAASAAADQNKELGKSQRIILTYFKPEREIQMRCFISELVRQCGLQVPSDVATVDELGNVSICSNVPMSKFWTAAQTSLRDRFDDQYGPVFVSLLRHHRVGCDELAKKLDPHGRFAYGHMEIKLRRIETITRTLGSLLNIDDVASAVKAQSPPPTPRDLSRCDSSADLVALLVRSDRVACLEPLCPAGKQGEAAALLAELLSLMADLTTPS